MANGKEPKTTGEHIIALYGHITGVKRDLKELREESSQMHEKFESKFDKLDLVDHWRTRINHSTSTHLAFNLIK
jgi:hypothetical protein